MWKCVHGAAPEYLQELCVLVEDVRGRPRLRSASTRCIQLSRVRTSTGQRSFAFHGPSVWSSLPSTLRDSSSSLRAFKGRSAKDVYLRSWTITKYEHHPALLGRFVIVAPSMFRLTYLLTYLLRMNAVIQVDHRIEPFLLCQPLIVLSNICQA